MPNRPSGIMWTGSSDPEGGARFEPDYAVRREPMIAILKSELRMMNSLNAIATFASRWPAALDFWLRDFYGMPTQTSR